MDDEQFQQLIGQLLRKYRKDRSHTIEKLAEDLDISPNHLGRIERGESDTTLTIFIKMAAILDIPNDFIKEIKQLYNDTQA